MAAGAVETAPTKIQEDIKPRVNMTINSDSNGSASRALADELQQAVQGKVLTPASGPDFVAAANSPHINPDYLGVSQPALVLQPECAEDICAAVKFARERNLSVAAKGGGHSFMGLWKAQNGLTIDMRSLAAKDGVKIDPKGRTARVSGGAVYTEILAAGAEHDLFIPWANAANTGMGLALHGGAGLSCRAFGVSADSILSAKVVTADGKLVTADASENQDLLEGIRGAGGALGIATELVFRLHDYSCYFGGSKLWLDPNGTLFRKAFDFSRMTLKDHPNLGIMLVNVGNPKNGLRMLQLSASYPGGEISEQDKQAAFKPLAEMELEMDAIIIQNSLGKLRYPELEMDLTNVRDRSRAANPEHAQFGVSCVITFDKVNEDFFEAVWDALTGVPQGMTALMQLDFLGGAVRNTNSFNPFAGMDLHFLVLFSWHDSAISDAAAVAVCKQKRDKLAKVVAHVQAYANSSTLYDDAYLEVQAGGAQKLARLRELKAKCDPDNIFRNHPYNGL